MIAQNIAHAAVQAGHSVLFTTAAQRLLDLGSQESARGLDQRLRHYCNRVGQAVMSANTVRQAARGHLPRQRDAGDTTRETAEATMNEVLEVRAVRVAHALNALFVLGTFAAAIVGHAGQPDRVPAHFDLAGVPNRWVDKSWGNTLAVPFMALGITVLIYGGAQLVGWARKHPEMLNMPDKEAFLALPSDLQDPIWRQMKAMIYWLGVPVTLLFPTMVGLSPTKDGRLRVWPMFVLEALVFVLLAVLGIRVLRAARRAIAAGTRRSLA